MGGATVQWLRDGLGIIRHSDEIEALAASVPDTGDVYLVPAFAGLGAPQWDAAARGTIVGLTRGSTRAHLARAALESIAFQTADLIEAMQQDGGRPLSELRVDGGAARNDLSAAVPGRPAGSARAAPGEHRDHGVRRRRLRRSWHRAVAITGGARLAVAARQALRARGSRATPSPRVVHAGNRRSRVRATGPWLKNRTNYSDSAP